MAAVHNLNHILLQEVVQRERLLETVSNFWGEICRECFKKAMLLVIVCVLVLLIRRCARV